MKKFLSVQYLGCILNFFAQLCAENVFSILIIHKFIIKKFNSSMEFIKNMLVFKKYIDACGC